MNPLEKVKAIANNLFDFDDFGDNFGCIEFDLQEWNKILHLYQIKSP